MGGGKPRVKLIFDALAAARGTAINASDPTTIAYVETLAVARAIAAAWGTNERLSYQWDPWRMSPAMLARWERIFALQVSPNDDISVRRARLARAQTRVGRGALLTTIQNELSDALGAVLVGVEFVTPTNAVVTVPDPGYPFGVVVPGAPWSSSAAKILVRVQAPAGYSEADFYNAVGLISERLEPLIPAWSTWDWYRAPQVGAPITVAGGPSAAGFYLDERNLNESVFDDVSTGLDPFLLAASGWYGGLAAYSGSPWLPTRSLGSSAANGNLASATPPSVGTPLNGFAPASFNGTTQYLATTTALTQDLLGPKWSLAMLVKPAVTAATLTSGFTYVDPCVIADTGTYFYLSFTTSGFTVGQIPTPGGRVEVTVPAAGGVPHMVQAWNDGTRLYLSVDGVVASQPCAVLFQGGGAGIVQVGRDYSGTLYTPVDIWELLTFRYDIGANARGGLRNRMNRKYALSL